MAHGPLPKHDSGLTIKGTAGPFVVRASNFAPGTTAADIEAAVSPAAMDDQGKNGFVSCRILTASPTVMAEMVFSERYIAERIVEKYNNAKADGRTLHLYLSTDPSSPPLTRSRTANAPIPTAPAAQRELLEAPGRPSQDTEMTTEETYDASREVVDRDRTSRNPRAEPLMQNTRARVNGDDIIDNRTAQADGPKGAADQRMDDRLSRREDTRGRGYDNRYNGQYDRRDDRDDYRRGRSDHGRGEQSSRFGNGMGRGPRENYGRMYSDDVVRGLGRGSYGNYR